MLARNVSFHLKSNMLTAHLKSNVFAALSGLQCAATASVCVRIVATEIAPRCESR
jgi:hypothetical protein